MAGGPGPTYVGPGSRHLWPAAKASVPGLMRVRPDPTSFVPGTRHLDAAKTTSMPGTTRLGPGTTAFEASGVASREPTSQASVDKPTRHAAEKPRGGAFFFGS